MNTIVSLRRIIEHKKNDFFLNHNHLPESINLNIKIYRKLIDFLTEQEMTIDEFEQSIKLKIFINNSKDISLH